LVPDKEPLNPPPRARVSNAEARARAATFLDHGDEHFRKQKFNEAYARYRDAAKEAPDLAEPYLHEAFALAAIGQYENAAKALRRGLAIKPDWPRSGFQLKSLYADNKIAKIAHRESLAKAVSEHPDSPDLMFLLAVVLYCDDDPQRSQAFFLRAKALEPGDTSYMKGFFDVLARGPAVQPAPPAPQDL
jgi:tetratricopeptide (TPR) repeat protein